jgi:hypothetical protein
MGVGSSIDKIPESPSLIACVSCHIAHCALALQVAGLLQKSNILAEHANRPTTHGSLRVLIVNPTGTSMVISLVFSIGTTGSFTQR